MKLNVYSIFDSVANAFIPPFFMANDAMAIRACSDALTDSNHQFFKHPTDYTLFRIAEFDDSNGVIVPRETHLNLGILSTFIPKE